MPRAVVMQEAGGPEVLRFQDAALGVPWPGELRVRQTATGVNLHDVRVRTGLYRTLALPGIPGIEAAGIVTAAGPETGGFAQLRQRWRER